MSDLASVCRSQFIVVNERMIEVHTASDTCWSASVGACGCKMTQNTTR